jgi:DNA-binding MarR family transcriptional regulator
MKGVDRLRAIDLSAKRLQERIPRFPQNTIHVLRILRAADIAVGDYFEKLLKPAGVNGSEFHTLAILSSCDNGISSPSELAELVGQTRANMTRILDSLIKSKYVTRTADRRDGRRRSVAITAQGERFLSQCVGEFAPLLSKCLSDFNRSELGMLERLLRKMIESLDRGQRGLVFSADFRAA